MEIVYHSLVLRASKLLFLSTFSFLCLLTPTKEQVNFEIGPQISSYLDEERWSTIFTFSRFLRMGEYYYTWNSNTLLAHSSPKSFPNQFYHLLLHIFWNIPICTKYCQAQGCILNETGHANACTYIFSSLLFVFL